MEAFAPVPALIGGLLIGVASAILWVGNGRIAGISGLYGNFLPPAGTLAWRGAFLVAMIAGAWIAAQLFPGLGVGGPGDPAVQLASAPEGWAFGTPLWLAIAGLLTGIGTRIGNGCTSGHGICGLARLSPRSFVAVGIFFGVAIITTTLTGVV